MTVLLVAVGAAIGAPLRYLVDRAVRGRHEGVFPWGTFAVNVTGSLVLGFVAGLPVSGPAMALLGTGFCGALTTYSTFGHETLRLTEDGAGWYAVANVAASVTCCLAAGFAGLMLARAVGG
jgi:fluoride exporter